MNFLQGPAQTTSYMILGLSVIIGFMILFVISLAVRFRSLRMDLQVLQEVEDEATSTQDPG